MVLRLLNDLNILELGRGEERLCPGQNQRCQKENPLASPRQRFARRPVFQDVKEEVSMHRRETVGFDRAGEAMNKGYSGEKE